MGWIKRLKMNPEEKQADLARENAAKEETLHKMNADEALLKKRAEFNRQVNAYEKQHAKEAKQAPSGIFLSAQNLTKIYSNRVAALRDFSLDVKEGEFIVLVGPSGCGKSTTLRMIAGLEDITSGDLYIDGRYVNKLEPKDREVAMVFQSYALYPHMSVYENMAFGLSEARIPEEKKNPDGSVSVSYRKITKNEINERIQEAAESLQITEYLQRKPTALSGGQCQRVALGRALVRHAKVFLLDEPLSNLDAKLRVQMRSELVRLHSELKNTMIYVTHDQTEAMTMADRIVIMKKGLVQQVGNPREVYDHPSNIFVATFIGSPTMNILSGHYERGQLRLEDGASIALTSEEAAAHDAYYEGEVERLTKKIEEAHDLMSLKERDPEAASKLFPYDYEGELAELEQELSSAKTILSSGSHDIFFGIRPEDISFSQGQGLKEVTLDVVELLGSDYNIHFKLGEKNAVAAIPVAGKLVSGDRGFISFDMKKAHLFDALTEKTIF